MSKVQTLLKVISYQKEHPFSTDAEISKACGISERYLRECKKELSLLSSHLSKPLLERSEVDLLLSKLSRNVGNELQIYLKLQKAYIGEKDGLIRIAYENDGPSMEYLRIGLWTPKDSRAHIDFWLTYLLYSTLLWVDEEGEINYRLACSISNTEGYKKWRVKIFKNLHWSDGKPITVYDVISTLTKSRLAQEIKEVKKGGEEEIVFTLEKDDVLFPCRLGGVPILPSHVLENQYSVTSGPYRLKISKKETTFNLIKNKDYFKTNHPFIDWIFLKTFSRSPFAVKAVMKKDLDFFPLRSLHQAFAVEKTASPQSFPFSNSSYYLLLINKERGYFKDESNVIKLKESIDYNAINLYLSATAPKEIFLKPRKLKKLDLKIGYLADMPAPFLIELALIVAYSLGTSAMNVVNVKGKEKDAKEAVDVILAQLYFGYGYSRLKRYFHSKGENNFFGFNYPEIDNLLDKLEKTAEMKERKAIGQEVIDMLQKEDAICLIAPCLEYFLSNLILVPDSRLSSLTYFILNLSSLKVSRGRVTI